MHRCLPCVVFLKADDEMRVSMVIGNIHIQGFIYTRIIHTQRSAMASPKGEMFALEFYDKLP